MRKSIGGKINFLIIFSLIALSICMIGVNLVIINRYTKHNSEFMIKKTCETQALQLDNQFELIEQSVQSIYAISESMRPNVDELQDKEIVDAFIQKFKDNAISIANGTEGALALYYRINPEITSNGSEGFFYVKSLRSGCLEESEVTDLLEYDVNDVEHVGWYYIPVWAGKPVWMDPYFNANIGVYMISYVMPIYDGNTLIGVVGIDVDFNAIKQIAENVDVYETSGAVLCSMQTGEVYYNQCGIFGNELPADLYTRCKMMDESEIMFSYQLLREHYGMYYKTLENDMKLLVYAREDEINRQRWSSILISSVIFLIVFIITLLMAIRVSRRIVKPISLITEVSKKYAMGDWDATVSCDTQDELQELTDNIVVMAEKTKEYIGYIQGLANKDALTGLRNKTDYMSYLKVINENYIPNRKPFAVFVFDLNNLKTINDNYGHEKGDELIVAASQFICNSFVHSPVFRIGGDEFVAIADSQDFDKRFELLETFVQHMKQTKDATDIVEVCIACGMASYDAEGDTYEQVFAVADQRMYENKKMLKGNVAPR